MKQQKICSGMAVTACVVKIYLYVEESLLKKAFFFRKL